MSRTSDNPHRPRLASSPSPLHRGTFGYRQNNNQLSNQGLTQTPLAPAGEETGNGPRLNARPLSERRQAQSGPRGLGRPLCRPTRIRATCAVGSGKEHRREAIQKRGAAVTATRDRTDPRPVRTNGSEKLEQILICSKPIPTQSRGGVRRRCRGGGPFREGRSCGFGRRGGRGCVPFAGVPHGRPICGRARLRSSSFRDP